MSSDASFHMSPEAFRRWDYAVVDWVADYQRRVESLPVFSRVCPCCRPAPNLARW